MKRPKISHAKVKTVLLATLGLIWRVGVASCGQVLRPYYVVRGQAPDVNTDSACSLAPDLKTGVLAKVSNSTIKRCISLTKKYILIEILFTNAPEYHFSPHSDRLAAEVVVLTCFQGPCQKCRANKQPSIQPYSFVYCVHNSAILGGWIVLRCVLIWQTLI